MTTQGIMVRWQRPEDEHGESVVRAADAPRIRPPNLHWPQATAEAASAHIVGEADGKVVGRAILEPIYPPFAEIQNMHVLEPYRGRGVGGAMVDACIAEAARLGFMAVFLQTHANYTPAQRLYARKGFVLASKAQMLRLVRFLNLPALDLFLHEHPLATYSSSAGEAEGEWSLTWQDWVTGDRLLLTLTGGTCDKDSNGYGPGLRALSLRNGGLNISAQISGPAKAAKGANVELGLEVHHDGLQPVHVRTRLLLPPGCVPQGEWSRMGPAQELRPSEALSSAAEVALTEGLDLAVLKYAAFESLPLTVEVFLGPTSFWLTHTIRIAA